MEDADAGSESDGSESGTDFEDESDGDEITDANSRRSELAYTCLIDGELMFETVDVEGQAQALVQMLEEEDQDESDEES